MVRLRLLHIAFKDHINWRIVKHDALRISSSIKLNLKSVNFLTKLHGEQQLLHT